MRQKQEYDVEWPRLCVACTLFLLDGVNNDRNMMTSDCRACTGSSFAFSLKASKVKHAFPLVNAKPRGACFLESVFIPDWSSSRLVVHQR